MAGPSHLLGRWFRRFVAGYDTAHRDEIVRLVDAKVADLATRSPAELGSLPECGDEDLSIGRARYVLMTWHDRSQGADLFVVNCWTSSGVSVIVYSNGFFLTTAGEQRMMASEEIRAFEME